MIRRGAAAAAVVLSVLALTSACGGDDGDSDAPSTEVRTIEVDIESGEVTPDGDRIDVGVDQPVDLVITSDEAGEVHVHATTEQSYEFAAGTNEPIALQFDVPGLIEIELHEPVEAPVVELRVE